MKAEIAVLLWQCPRAASAFFSDAYTVPVHNTSPNKSAAVIVNDHNADGTTCAERPRHSPITGLCDDLAILTTARVRLLVDSFVE